MGGAPGKQETLGANKTSDCSSSASFALAVGKDSTQNSVSNLVERNSVCKCDKCISVATLALTHRF